MDGQHAHQWERIEKGATFDTHDGHLEIVEICRCGVFRRARYQEE